jgi:hypothetical protein
MMRKGKDVHLNTQTAPSIGGPPEPLEDNSARNDIDIDEKSRPSDRPVIRFVCNVEAAEVGEGLEIYGSRLDAPDTATVDSLPQTFSETGISTPVEQRRRGDVWYLCHPNQMYLDLAVVPVAVLTLSAYCRT